MRPGLPLAALLLPAAGFAAAPPSPLPPQQLDRVDVRADKARYFSLPLDAAPSTGSRLGLTARELPASVSLVTQEMMQERGLRTAVEAVESAVGMTGGLQFGSIPTYSARGFGGNNVSVLRDGIRQNTASQSSRPLDAFLLDRIEILKGPDGLLFGEGAIGGAVNYLSKSAMQPARTDLLLSTGSWDSYRIGLGFGGALGRSHAHRGPLRYRLDLSHAEAGGYVAGNRQRYQGGSLALAWTASPAFRLAWTSTALRDWNESYFGTPVIYDQVIDTTRPDAVPEVRLFNSATDRMLNARIDPATRRINYNVHDNSVRTENTFHRLRAEWSLTPQLELKQETYTATQLLRWRNVENQLWNPITRLVQRSAYAVIYRDDLLLGTRLDLHWDGNLAGRPHRVVVGGIFERNDQIRGGPPGNAAPTIPAVSLLDPDRGFAPAARFTKTARVVVGTRAWHAQSVWAARSDLKLVAGARQDWIEVQRDTLANPTTTPATPFATFRRRYTPVTGRLGAVWSRLPGVHLYASASRAAEPVSQLVSLSTAQAEFSLQRGTQYEVGAKASTWDNRLDVTFALFALSKSDLLTATLDPVTGLRRSQQVGEQRSRGAELATAFTPAAGWRLEANVAFTDAWFESFQENVGAGVLSRNGNRPVNVPRWVMNAYVSRQLTRQLTLSGGPRYVGERFGNTHNTVVADDYVVLDAALSYRWEHWVWSLHGRNLLDRAYEPVAGTTQRRLADPRSVELSVRFSP